MSKDLLKRAEEESDYMKSMVNPAGAKDRAAWAALIQELLDKIKGDAERLESNDINKLLQDMRCDVVWTDKATMPIPLYERMKAAINAIKGDDKANG